MRVETWVWADGSKQAHQRLGLRLGLNRSILGQRCPLEDSAGHSGGEAARGSSAYRDA